ncbi:MAG TPA: DUF2277 domain-containing protein [Thermoanaerobaculia bacterium]|nr:DUF2277 domain-containing protein [Thermoanaerobaculia bacterium]
MCRNIKRLHNLAPPATPDEVRDAALQFVRKISNTRRPSQANAAAFERAVDEITAASRRLLESMVTPAEPKTREELAAQARQRRLAS